MSNAGLCGTVIYYSNSDVVSVSTVKALLILIGFLSALSTTAETVHIGSGDWPPFLSDSMEKNGLASAIVCEVFALEGIQVEYHFFRRRNRYFVLPSNV